MFWVAVTEMGLMEMPESGRITPAPSSSQNLMSFEAASEPSSEFHACIQVLGVFANDNQVDVIVTASSAGHGQHRTQAHIQVERFAKRNVDAAETGSNGSGARALDGNLVALHRLDSHQAGRCPFSPGACHLPASTTSQTISAPAASTTCCIAADVSKPMPSPGIKVTVCCAIATPSVLPPPFTG